MELRLRGTQRRYCSQACRQRAYEVRTAARRAEADRQAGRARPSGPVREVVERHTVRTVTRQAPPPPPEVVEVEVPVVAVPTRAGEVAAYLEQVAGAIVERRIAHHDHRRVYAGVMRVLAAIDQTHPGGLDRLDPRRRRR